MAIPTTGLPAVEDNLRGTGRTVPTGTEAGNATYTMDIIQGGRVVASISPSIQRDKAPHMPMIGQTCCPVCGNLSTFPEFGHMPQYFFDYRDGERVYIDDEGAELASLKKARAEAQRAIGAIAKDEMPDGDTRDFQISIREGEGPVLMVVTLAIRVENK